MNKKSHIVEDNNLHGKFAFSNSFKRTFDGLVDAYSNALEDLNKVSKGKKIDADYGVCSCHYMLRYITPNDISEYISNFIKGLGSHLFQDRKSDIELFTVASVKRFIEANGCPAFEDATVLNEDHSYINPKEATLNDLAFIAKNDIGEIGVYSGGEIMKRIELAGDDIKKMNDMHFAANIKKIVSSLPSVLEKADCYPLANPAGRNIFTLFLEEFLLFTCTLNTIGVLQLLAYCKPTSDYTVKKTENNNIVTECCLLKTNNYMIRHRIPFNCNMRDIALQDVTPNFKDVHDALHFIMKDARSPIMVLVNKFATKEADVNGDTQLIARMFIGEGRHYHDDNIFKKDGERVIGDNGPMDVAGFETHVDWLDNIAFGNNYLDGNYRKDAMGNAHVHPLTNSLDMLFKLFSGCDLKTNEELANNIVRVANAIRGIIHNYADGEPIENYQITKDVLVLLGEIMTRNMLRLHYNNTHVITYTDDMTEAGAPGFIEESFVLEADANTNANANNANKPSVTFANAQGQLIKTNAAMKASAVFQKFVQWVKNTMSKFSEKFNENHKREIEWVKKNDALNKAIGTAINEKRFLPTVNNLPPFKISLNEIKKGNLSEEIKKYADPSTKLPENMTLGAIEMSCGNKEFANKVANAVNKIQNQQDKDKKAAEMVTNWLLFNSDTRPQTQPGQLDKNRWDEIVNDLINSPKLIDEITKHMTDQLTKASDYVAQQLKQLENAQGDDVAPKKERFEQLGKIVQNANNIYMTPVINNTIKEFYSVNYTIYREIVTAYQQQSKNGQLNQAATTQQQPQNGQQNTEQQNADQVEQPTTT